MRDHVTMQHLPLAGCIHKMIPGVFGKHVTYSCGELTHLQHHESLSTLLQVMACCLTTPSHYLNSCWLIKLRSCRIPLMTISQKMLKISIFDWNLKMTNLILQPHHPGTNELPTKSMWLHPSHNFTFAPPVTAKCQTQRAHQNGQHFADDTFKCVLLLENDCIKHSVLPMVTYFSDPNVPVTRRQWFNSNHQSSLQYISQNNHKLLFHFVFISLW